MNDLFQHLKSYGFVKAHKVRRRTNKIQETKLADLIESYFDVARNRPLVIQAPLGVTDIYPDSRGTPFPLNTIQQLAIYAGRIYIHDPLLELVYTWQNLDQTSLLLIKYPTREERIGFFRNELAVAIERLFILKPLIEAGIVHIAPTELVHPKSAPGALYSDDFYGPSELQEDIGPHLTLQNLHPQLKKYCDESMVVRPVVIENGEPKILYSEELSSCNMIAIGFSGDPDIYKYYQLFNILPPDETGDNASEMHLQMFFDVHGKKPVDKNTFENWVKGSKYKSVSEILDRLQQELNLAHLAGAKFVTDIRSSRDLALTDLSSGTLKTDDQVLTALLKFNLPYFENADITSIIKARQNEAAFEEFRSALNKAFKEIESLPQSEQFQEQVTEIYKDLLITPLANIDRQAKILKRNLFLSAAILLGSLTATFITQGNTLVTAATIYAATEIAKMYRQEKAEEDKVKQLPSFFYWELTRKGK